jgi:hypothetical protein
MPAYTKHYDGKQPAPSQKLFRRYHTLRLEIA